VLIYRSVVLDEEDKGFDILIMSLLKIRLLPLIMRQGHSATICTLRYQSLPLVIELVRHHRLLQGLKAIDQGRV
jgi:hypothetical protein